MPFPTGTHNGGVLSASEKPTLPLPPTPAEPNITRKKVQPRRVTRTKGAARQTAVEKRIHVFPSRRVDNMIFERNRRMRFSRLNVHHLRVVVKSHAVVEWQKSKRNLIMYTTFFPNVTKSKQNKILSRCMIKRGLCCCDEWYGNVWVRVCMMRSQKGEFVKDGQLKRPRLKLNKRFYIVAIKTSLSKFVQCWACGSNSYFLTDPCDVIR